MIKMNDLNDYIGKIYEASILPENWPTVLNEFSVSIDGAFASLLTFDGSVLRWTGTAAYISLIDEYKPYEIRAPNTRIDRAIRKGWPGFVTDYDLFAPAEMDDDPFYSEFMRPRGFGWTVGTFFQLSTGDMLVISAERLFSKGPVESHYVRYLDLLRPHFARSALLSARLRLERADAMGQALEMIGLPSAVLLRNGRMLHCNALFSSLIPGAFLDYRGRLRLANADADRLFQTILDDQGAAKSRSIPVVASETNPPTVIHLLPVCRNARDIFTGIDRLLVVTPVERKNVLSTAVLNGLFDLTPSEAILAKQIGEARSIEHIARQSGLSRETIRSRLKTVLAKTGLHRQSELVHLLSSISVHS